MYILTYNISYMTDLKKTNISFKEDRHIYRRTTSINPTLRVMLRNIENVK